MKKKKIETKPQKGKRCLPFLPTFSIKINLIPFKVPFLEYGREKEAKWEDDWDLRWRLCPLPER